MNCILVIIIYILFYNIILLIIITRYSAITYKLCEYYIFNYDSVKHE